MFTLSFSSLSLILSAPSSTPCLIPPCLNHLYIDTRSQACPHGWCLLVVVWAGLTTKPDAFKGIISFVDQLYHSLPRALWFAYVFSVHISVDGPVYLRKCKLYSTGADKGEQEMIREAESLPHEGRQEFGWFSLQK